MPEEGAMPAVHGQEEVTGGRGQHQHAVPVPSRSQMPAPAHRRRRRPRQSLHRRPHTNLLGLLHLIIIIIIIINNNFNNNNQILILSIRARTKLLHSAFQICSELFITVYNCL